MDKDALEGIGLTRAESEVYVSLLRLGSSTIGPILRQSGLHSSVVYNCMQRLFEKGLVSYTTKGRVKHFAAAEPRHLMEMLKEREDALSARMPELEAMMGSARSSQAVFVFEGAGAGRTVFDDILHTLKKGEEHLVMGVSEGGSGFEGLVKRWDERRARKGIKKRVLVAEGERAWAGYYRKQPLTRVRIMPGLLDTKMTVNVYGGKAVLVLWGRHPTYIMVDRPEIADSFRKYFNSIWSVSKRAD